MTQEANTKLAKFVVETINTMVKLGGVLVDEKTYEKRIDACDGCNYAGTVEPIPTVRLKGCTICKCPFETKPKFEKYFSVSKLKVVEVECPHPDGDKWIF